MGTVVFVATLLVDLVTGDFFGYKCAFVDPVPIPDEDFGDALFAGDLLLLRFFMNNNLN